MSMDIVFKKTITEAGITVEEAAKLFEVTKPTLYNWGKGMTPKSAAVYKRALKVCGLLRIAIERGELPLPESVMKENRVGKVHAIIFRESK